MYIITYIYNSYIIVCYLTSLFYLYYNKFNFFLLCVLVCACVCVNTKEEYFNSATVEVEKWVNLMTTDI